jgi:hypothetical protein
VKLIKVGADVSALVLDLAKNPDAWAIEHYPEKLVRRSSDYGQRIEFSLRDWGFVYPAPRLLGYFERRLLRYGLEAWARVVNAAAISGVKL